MPILKCGKNGFKFGESGKCFTGPGAREKAEAQGRAIKASQAEALKTNSEDKMKDMELNAITVNIHKFLRHDTYRGKKHLVAPVTMLVEGVHNEILYTNEEMSKFPEAWDGRDIPINHPQVNGEFVSVKNENIEEPVVGKVFNAKFVKENDIGKLKAEMWIEEETGQANIPEIMQDIHKGLPVEVSTGLFTQNELTEGAVVNKITNISEVYKAIAHNYRPDHLAILTDELGACSISKGCGLNVNKEEELKGKDNMNDNESLFRKIKNTFKGTKKKKELQTNELSHDDIRNQLRVLIRDQFTDDDFVWVREVFDKTFIYEVESSGMIQLFRQGYVVDANDEVSLVGERIEVEEQTEFVPVTNSDNPNTLKTNKGEKNQMDEKERSELVDSIIANKANSFGDDEKEVLQDLSDEVLKKMSEVPEVDEESVNEEEPKKKEEKPKTNAQEDCGCDEGEEDKGVQTNADESSKLTLENIRKVVNEAVDAKLAVNAKKPLVEQILANKANVLSEEVLKAMPEDELKKYANSFTQNFYRGAGAPTNLAINEQDEGPEPMPVIDFQAAAGNE